MVKKLYLIRHAKPEFPGPERYCLGGRTDWPVGKEGKQQCERLASELRPVFEQMEENGIRVEIWSSPMVRAVQTASCLCAEGTEPGTMEGFREMDAGLWDGLPFSRIREEFPAEYAARKENRAMSLIPGAERDEDGLNRFKAALKKLMETSEADVIVLVAHATVIQLLRAFLAGRPLHESIEYKPQYTEYIELDAREVYSRI